MRVLIVEDNVDLYNDYILRIFHNLLPLDKIEIVHMATLGDALSHIDEVWDVILMDYSLDKPVELDGHRIKDGADLVAIRRAVEGEDPEARAFIIGTSSNQVGNRLMVDKGADTSFLKLHVVEMAKEIEQRL